MNTKMIEMSLESDLQRRRKFTELDSLYRKSPNGVGVLDRELRYLCVNQAMTEFHGLQRLQDIRYTNCCPSFRRSSCFGCMMR